MKIIITGDSNTAAIKHGFKMLQKESQLPNDIVCRVIPLGSGRQFKSQFFRTEDNKAIITEPRYESKISQFPIQNYEDAWYGFCGPFHSAKVYGNRDWRNYSTIKMKKSKYIISESLLRRVILDDQRYLLSLMEFLVNSSIKVFAIESPRPFISKYNIKGDVILFIDREYRKLITSTLAEIGVPVVNVPKSCINEDGSMKEIYHNGREGDRHHGSHKFGALMVKEIYNFLTQKDSIPSEDRISQM